jgi:hypothetical protein
MHQQRVRLRANSEMFGARAAFKFSGVWNAALLD